MTKMWMIRGEAGRYYDDFREKGIAGIGWLEFAAQAKVGMSREELIALYRASTPGIKQGSAISGASQVWRFLNEIAVGDWVVTYSPLNRTYSVGNITGEANHSPELAADEIALIRPVQWLGKEVERDSLSQPSKNSLGSTMTVFVVGASAAEDLLAQARGEPTPKRVVEEVNDDVLADPIADVESLALERIKDLVSALSWSDMQELVAGLLRAMGYKTQVSPAGADRGRDIIASPDGFGFENPRIVVEVKHRQGAMGSQSIRSFLGGRHKDDRGLYVSTGGFTKDSYYEADRAQVPLTLWTLDNLVRTLVDHYDQTDTETKRLVPLKRMYVPA
ncbi:MAG: restriction endonuclease [Alcaligenaceae bacterium]|nr:MAG: restriction endonuclease [Alcaligenaceae bacterium]